MVSAGVLGIGSDVEPHLVHELKILRTHARRVRPQQILAGLSARLGYLQNQTRSRFGQAFPSVSQEFGLLVGSQLVGKTADDLTRVQPLRGYDDGFENVGGGNDEQENRLAFLFRDRNGGGE